MTPPRALAEGWFRQTLAALAPRRLVREQAPADAAYARVTVLALGKAAGPMLRGWLDAAPPALLARTEAWLCAPAGAPELDAAAWRGCGLPVHRFGGGHPEPNRDSQRAAEAMLAAARPLAVWSPTSGGRAALLVALLSGGGSALAELPRDGDLERCRRLHRALVSSGAPIGEINLVRKHLSAFKGGWLAAAASGAEQVSYILSDVPGADLGAVASGPTCPDASTRAEAEAALWRWLPQEAAAWAPSLAETPKPGDAAFANARWVRLAGNDDACAALARLARAGGCAPVVVDHAADEWTSEDAAPYLVARWRRLRSGHARPCLIAGGEVRVRVPRQGAGRGGRNCDLALRVAMRLAGERFCFLSAGTDGVDGASGVAGACVDGDTLARAAGRSAEAALAGFDSAAFLDAAGDLVRTGPTGNNLRDLRIFL